MDGMTRASGPVAAAVFATNRVEREVGLNERVTMEVAISDFVNGGSSNDGGKFYVVGECC